MKKEYKKIEFGFGDIDSAVKELLTYKQKNQLVFGEFNGTALYSDVDTLDSAYQKITGKTKAEYAQVEKEAHDEYEKEKKEHEEAIPKLTGEWIEKGKKILDEEYWESWTKCVPIRLGDLYRGMELGMCLDIVSKLNKGRTLKHVKTIIDRQGHSGMSFGLVRSMVKSFCKRGDEFVKHVK